ncbi:uncharacterized protein TNCV_2887551 [Trichonephila clavipes]|nr:uncharacterized protein TNCV_2887551 [Trichonephila clavipes]
MGSRSRHPQEKDSSNVKQNTTRHDERTLSNAHKPNRVLTFLTSLYAIGPSRTDHTTSTTEPGTPSQGTLRSRYGMEESVQIPVPKIKSEVESKIVHKRFKSLSVQ